MKRVPGLRPVPLKRPLSFGGRYPAKRSKALMPTSSTKPYVENTVSVKKKPLETQARTHVRRLHEK
jgi:hypothetical protein